MTDVKARLKALEALASRPHGLRRVVSRIYRTQDGVTTTDGIPLDQLPLGDDVLIVYERVVMPGEKVEPIDDKYRVVL
jgi:hypothetical protein